ncbi:MAG TPA: hypothetical protein VD926_04580, partial [Acidimicrobiales bacterium]|nr:hypothetical protein [Acidimicrobiales bacterium]
MDAKAKAIAIQNATTAAATLYASMMTPDETFSIEVFDVLRDAIAAGTVERITAAELEAGFPGAVNVTG